MHSKNQNFPSEKKILFDNKIYFAIEKVQQNFTKILKLFNKMFSFVRKTKSFLYKMDSRKLND